MAFGIYNFLDHRGRKPVKEFIESLPIKEQAKVYAYLKELSHEGPNLKRPMADYVGHGIYELRPKNNRIFYFFFLKNNVVLLHAIKKNTNKISKGDLVICYRRKVIVGMFQKLERVEIRR